VSLRKLRHPCTYAFDFHSRFFELDCYSCAKPAPTNNSIPEMWRLSSETFKWRDLCMATAQAALATDTSESTEPAQTSNQPPVDKIRIGRVCSNIWRNSGEKGDFYSVTLERNYKDGETRKTTQSLGSEDLLVAAKILDKAFDRIVELQGRG
jgi:hypothetical protein